MALTSDFLDAVAIAAARIPGPMIVPWPMPGELAGFLTFTSFNKWQEFVLRFSLRDTIPQTVTAKFDRAQKLHLLAWIDFDLIKAGELIALTTLELALKDRYGQKIRRSGNATFARLLSYMAQHDGITDEMVGMNCRCGGGAIVDLLTGKRKPSLAQIRNDLAHSFPFDGFPRAGLLELVRDLIEDAYRDSLMSRHKI